MNGDEIAVAGGLRRCVRLPMNLTETEPYRALANSLWQIASSNSGVGGLYK